MEKKKVINVPESILLVSSFFMFIFISKYLVFIPELEYFFERDSLWFAFPLITLIIGIYSFLNREI
ncbi:hypothetical protein [Psychrobacillus sp. OK032]|uniref:hypothetical protein n=1 Tax=Psychrobacillus sp. OK032 TaxID=1884358 RepID=UPI0008C5391B|nr:hypothetical protein [Psychrobacillus sp. OK032]SES44442.1 hypothetical protein SAMN05518872_11415 [Psychrobacillus sp. OK032]